LESLFGFYKVAFAPYIFRLARRSEARLYGLSLNVKPRPGEQHSRIHPYQTIQHFQRKEKKKKKKKKEEKRG